MLETIDMSNLTRTEQAASAGAVLNLISEIEGRFLWTRDLSGNAKRAIPQALCDYLTEQRDLANASLCGTALPPVVLHEFEP